MHGSQTGNAGPLRGRREQKPRAAALITIVALVSLVAVACSSGEAERPAGEEQRMVAPGSTPTPTPVDVNALPDDFAPLEPGTYSIDPDGDPSTPLRVVYDVPAEGWSQWEGAVKFADDEGHVGVSITTMTNVVRHGCHDHSPADPPVGPSVEDLATALADLAPFRVTSPPTDVSIYGYRGKHLELTVPDLPVEESSFTGCIGGNLHSWIGPLTDAFYGYTGPPLHRGVLDPRRRGHPPRDRGAAVPRLAARGPRRAAGHPGLHTDRAMTRLAHARWIEGHLRRRPPLFVEGEAGMKTHHSGLLAMALMVALAGCAPASDATDTAASVEPSGAGVAAAPPSGSRQEALQRGRETRAAGAAAAASTTQERSTT